MRCMHSMYVCMDVCNASGALFRDPRPQDPLGCKIASAFAFAPAFAFAFAFAFASAFASAFALCCLLWLFAIMR